MVRRAAARHRAQVSARRRAGRLIASGGLVAALATGGLAAMSAGSTDATFTDTQRANGTVQAAQIAAPKDVGCSSILGLGAHAAWASATPSVSAPYSYRYVVHAYPTVTAFSTSAAVPSVGLPGNLLGLAGGATFAARAELLQSDTALWTSDPSYFNAVALLGTSCSSVAP